MEPAGRRHPVSTDGMETISVSQSGNRERKRDTVRSGRLNAGPGGDWDWRLEGQGKEHAVEQGKI